MSGDMESDSSTPYHVEHMHLHKVRMSKSGHRVGRGDYHAPNPDMIAFVGGLVVQESKQHVTDIQQEVKDHEGCRVHGYMDVKRVAGNFQFTVHLKDWMMAGMLRQAARAKAVKDGSDEDVSSVLDFRQANVSHHITKLSFGPTFPGQVNPLDGFHRIVNEGYGSFSYFMKVVPTTYVSSWWSKVATCQYSVSEYFVPGNSDSESDSLMSVRKIPALSFAYDISPLNVKIWYPGRSLGHFLVRLCAVLGGCFALTGWLDGLVHYLLRIAGK